MARCIPKSLPKEIAIVVSWVKFIGIARKQYELCLSPARKDIYIIEREDALRIIRNRGLVKAFDAAEEGSVYDSQEKGFLKKYKHWYSRLE